LKQIRKSDEYKEEQKVFQELQDLADSLGAVVAEDVLLDHITENEKIQNHLLFLLTLAENFEKKKEDSNMRSRWYVSKEIHDNVDEALDRLYSEMDINDLVPHSVVIEKFMEYVKAAAEHHRREEIVNRWLELSKKIDRNPLGEWGHARSQNVRVKGVRDYAYLVLRKHGSPMHFKEVAESIEKHFGKKAHIATTHNELIKDKRFVLVGRGLYALAEWGYAKGVVKDVIKGVLAKEGGLTRDEVVERVTRERYVKPNTILINLQDSEVFARDEEGRYYLKEDLKNETKNKARGTEKVGK